MGAKLAVTVSMATRQGKRGSKDGLKRCAVTACDEGIFLFGFLPIVDNVYFFAVVIPMLMFPTSVMAAGFSPVGSAFFAFCRS